MIVSNLLKTVTQRLGPAVRHFTASSSTMFTDPEFRSRSFSTARPPSEPMQIGSEFSLRDGTRASACKLSIADLADVREYYASLGEDTLGAVHGSYCALSSGIQGDTLESATADMTERFAAALDRGDVVLGLRTHRLIAMCFHMTNDQPITYAYGLTVSDDFLQIGAATALKLVQFKHARDNGFCTMTSTVGASEEYYGHVEKEHGTWLKTSILLTKAAQQAGLQVSIKKTPLFHGKGTAISYEIEVNVDLSSARD